jgi:hypothetical protein
MTVGEDFGKSLLLIYLFFLSFCLICWRRNYNTFFKNIYIYISKYE